MFSAIWTNSALRWLAASLLLALPSTLLPSALSAAECRQTTFDGARYSLCEVDMHSEDLRLFLNAPDTDAPLGSFPAIDTMLESEGLTLGFAMNAGMYHSNRTPVGHYVENGQQLMRLITNPGPGNFGLLPNGVLCLKKGRADVIETLRFEREAPACQYATQSGPMLVIDGALHPRFLPDSDSLYIRNGVGTTQDGTRAVFAISDQPVNFHTFARLFRDHLKLPQALYFDGSISRLYAPDLGRSDLGFPMGPVVGTVVAR
ncbi:phosphodiester glycosidase family protein [Rhodobacteraceae bacterium KMM 6894]|nr:phosphodiester glycosidase family protein [Rhodobacteraceae bacterium KMM 6894]